MILDWILEWIITCLVIAAIFIATTVFERRQGVSWKFAIAEKVELVAALVAAFVLAGLIHFLAQIPPTGLSSFVMVIISFFFVIHAIENFVNLPVFGAKSALGLALNIRAKRKQHGL